MTQKDIDKKMTTRLFVMFAVVLLAFLAIAPYYVKASGLPSITLLNQDPSPAAAGNTVTLWFQVENTEKTSINNATFNIVDEYPFTSISPAQTVDSIAPYQQGTSFVSIHFDVKIDPNTKQGTFPVKLQYTDSTGQGISQEFNVVITSQNYAQIIYVDKAQLSPGQQTDMNFTINNVGNAPLQNMIFSWNEPTGVILPVFSDNTRYIKYLDVGKSVTLTYKVVADVNANPGLYQLNMNLAYQSITNSSTTTVTSKGGIFIGGQTDFDVVFSQSTQGQTSLSVSNIGNTPAQSVSVSIPQQAGYQVTGSNSAIIGNLNKGDYTLVSFQITARATGTGGNFSAQGGAQGSGQAGGRFNSQNLTDQQIAALRQQFANRTSGGGQNAQGGLLVDVAYTDTTGQRVVLEKNVQVQFRGGNSTGFSGGTGGFSGRGSSSGFIGGTVFWIIIIVVVIVASYFIFGRRKKSSSTVNVHSTSKK